MIEFVGGGWPVNVITQASTTSPQHSGQGGKLTISSSVMFHLKLLVNNSRYCLSPQLKYFQYSRNICSRDCSELQITAIIL